MPTCCDILLLLPLSLGGGAFLSKWPLFLNVMQEVSTSCIFLFLFSVPCSTLRPYHVYKVGRPPVLRAQRAVLPCEGQVWGCAVFLCCVLVQGIKGRREEE